jgi:hypothetical protein
MTELQWAAIGLARYPHHFVNLAVVYVLNNSGPNWAEVVTAIATAVGALGVIGAIGAAWIARSSLRATLNQVRLAADQVKLAAKQVNEAEKERHISLVLEMARRWDDDLVGARREISALSREGFQRHYAAAERANTDQYYEWLKLANFFEDFGVLVKKECLDLDLVHETVGYSAVFYWEKWSGPIDHERDEVKGLYDNWEYLANQLVTKYPDDYMD